MLAESDRKLDVPVSERRPEPRGTGVTTATGALFCEFSPCVTTPADNVAGAAVREAFNPKIPATENSRTVAAIAPV